MSSILQHCTQPPVCVPFASFCSVHSHDQIVKMSWKGQKNTKEWAESHPFCVCTYKLPDLWTLESVPSSGSHTFCGQAQGSVYRQTVAFIPFIKFLLCYGKLMSVCFTGMAVFFRDILIPAELFVFLLLQLVSWWTQKCKTRLVTCEMIDWCSTNFSFRVMFLPLLIID